MSIGRYRCRLYMTTLCFPGIRAQLAALGRRSIQSLRQAILFQLGQNLRELIPVHILAWIFHTISSRDAARARLARRAKRFGVGLCGNTSSVEEREASAARRAHSKSNLKGYEISGLAIHPVRQLFIRERVVVPHLFFEARQFGFEPVDGSLLRRVVVEIA